jgi:hypothetical protein
MWPTPRLIKWILGVKRPGRKHNIELCLLLGVRTGSYTRTAALPICLHGVHRNKFRLLPLTDYTRTYWYCWAIREASSKATSVLWTASRESVCEMLWGVLDRLRYSMWLPYILVTVCTDIVTVRTPITYSNCTVATVHTGECALI